MSVEEVRAATVGAAATACAALVVLVVAGAWLAAAVWVVLVGAGTAAGVQLASRFVVELPEAPGPLPQLGQPVPPTMHPGDPFGPRPPAVDPHNPWGSA